jgi:hypothetical protein
MPCMASLGRDRGRNGDIPAKAGIQEPGIGSPKSAAVTAHNKIPNKIRRTRS